MAEVPESDAPSPPITPTKAKTRPKPRLVRKAEVAIPSSNGKKDIDPSGTRFLARLSFVWAVENRFGPDKRRQARRREEKHIESEGRGASPRSKRRVTSHSIQGLTSSDEAAQPGGGRVSNSEGAIDDDTEEIGRTHVKSSKASKDKSSKAKGTGRKKKNKKGEMIREAIIAEREKRTEVRKQPNKFGLV